MNNTTATDVGTRKLMDAIVVQAAKDYRKSLISLKKGKKIEKSNKMIKECEIFFESDWFKFLTDADKDFITQRIKDEVSA